MDDDGYPEDAELERIKQWPYTDPRGCFEYIHSLWNWPNYMSIEGREVSMSTGGWSGNEDLIGALQANVMIWALCWKKSERGGHFEFEIPQAYAEAA